MTATVPASAPPQHFGCMACGNCCRVPGYVILRPEECEEIAQHLGLGVDDFTATYTRLTENRAALSLNEQADRSCVFLTDENRCVINQVKPRQCRAFPREWNFNGYEALCAGRHLPRAGADENQPAWTPEQGLAAFRLTHMQ